ncbi:MAG TPA: hypothetical protein VI320_19550 [Terracidiphilus sp.]
MPVRCIQEDACISFVSGVEVHDGNPNPVDAPELSLEARSVRVFTNTRSLAANRFRDRPNRKIEFTGDTCRVEPARFAIEQSGISTQERKGSRHGGHLYKHDKVTRMARQSIENVPSKFHCGVEGNGAK